MDSSIFVGPSPWQLWGNTQIIELPPNPFTNPRLHLPEITLNRIQYNRPETWHFLFAARMVSGPDLSATIFQANASVWIELLTGIGRSVIKLPFFAQLEGWQWNGAAPPLGYGNQVWQNSVTTGVQTSFTDETPQVVTTWAIKTEQIVGQDITATAHGVFNTDDPSGQSVFVEVSGQWAPATHVRPDWYQIDGPPGEQFPGGEVKGR